MTEEQASALYDSEFWLDMTFQERAIFQIFTARMCMPFDVFQEAIEKTLGTEAPVVGIHSFLEKFRESLLMTLIPEKHRGIGSA